VSPFQLGAALALLAGGLLAISARDSRWVAGGLVVALGLAALLADPLPSPLAVAVRLVAAVLGAYVLLLALRGGAGTTSQFGQTDGPALGPIAPALAALAAAVVGYTTSGVGSPAAGPPIATAAGLALATLAVGPLFLGRDIVRIGTGMALLVTAAELVRAGLAGTPGPLEQAVSAGLSVAILGTIGAISTAALRAGHDLSVGPSVPRETLFEAHPLATASPSPIGRPLRRAPRAPGPAAGPRRDAAAHQLTFEERLRLADRVVAGNADESLEAAPASESAGPASESAGPASESAGPASE
jgi:hypothetical protein